jgi:hypothetical protein
LAPIGGADSNSTGAGAADATGWPENGRDFRLECLLLVGMPAGVGYHFAMEKSAMRVHRFVTGLAISSAICAPALADSKYTFHENLHVGQVIPFSMKYEYKIKSTSKENGAATFTDKTTRLDWKVKLTVLAEKDGSETRALADIDPGSSDTVAVDGQPPTKSGCPFAGKQITLMRTSDDSFNNDFAGDASDDDVSILNNFMSPDEDYYPDTPVAVGDIWDNSAKAAKDSQLGPKDQLMSRCRLDWVKSINGKPMAQITNSVAIVYYEPGHVEEDFEGTCTALIDMTTQMIVKADQTTTSTYKTPAKEPAQITGGTESTFHCELMH